MNHVIPCRVRVFFLIHSEFNSKRDVSEVMLVSIREASLRVLRILDKVVNLCMNPYHTHFCQSP